MKIRRTFVFDAWMGPFLALVGFTALFLAAAWAAKSFAKTSAELAHRDLGARAELAARALAEPLKTLDLKRVQEFGDECRTRGLRFCVRWGGVSGKVFYDSYYDPAAAGPSFWEWRKSGEFAVGLALERSVVLSPLFRAVPLFLLAALVGAAGMAFVFFAFYRQRAKIRELARIERERREFVADFSHELKTPLTGIIGAAEMLGDSCEGNAAACRLAGMVVKESRRLDRLARRIIDLSRLEGGAPSLNFVEIDVAELLGVGSGVMAKCDAEMIREAVDNLVENAHKHGGAGVKVDVRVRKVADAVEIVVEDDGVGIPKDERERIFERFIRLDASRASDTGGSGLGLAIVRRIACLHGGDCICEGVVPHGTRFLFRISANTHC